jgi:hypothetical protein
MPERIKISEDLQILASIIVGSIGGIIARSIVNKIKNKSEKEKDDNSKI